jgi:hypothetical protein
MDTLKFQTTDSFNMVSAKIEVEGHILKVTSAMNAVQRNLDLLIECNTRPKGDVISSGHFSHHLDGVADEERSCLP